MSQAKRNVHVVLACFLGWTIDAFDFFILIFVMGDIAKEFGSTVAVVSWAITLTLGLRVVGAGPVRATGRSLRTQARAHRQRPDLLRAGVRLRPRAEPGGVPRPARALRDRDGWRMGRGRKPDDGIDPGALARGRVGPAAVGLFLRLPPGRAALRRRLRCPRLARDVSRGDRAGAPGALYPAGRARKSRLASGAGAAGRRDASARRDAGPPLLSMPSCSWRPPPPSATARRTSTPPSCASSMACRCTRSQRSRSSTISGRSWAA